MAISSSVMFRQAQALFTSAMPLMSTVTCWPMPLSASWVCYCICISILFYFSVVQYGKLKTIHDISAEPPRVLTPPNHVYSVITNSRALLDCASFGSPLPKITWWDFYLILFCFTPLISIKVLTVSLCCMVIMRLSCAGLKTVRA